MHSSHSTVKNAKPKTKLHKLFDELELFQLVNPIGRKG